MNGQAIFHVIEGGRYAERMSLNATVPSLHLVLRRPAPRKRALLAIPAVILLAGAVLISPWATLPL